VGVPPPGSGFTCVGVKKGFWVLAALFYPASLRSVLVGVLLGLVGLPRVLVRCLIGSHPLGVYGAVMVCPALSSGIPSGYVFAASGYPTPPCRGWWSGDGVRISEWCACYPKRGERLSGHYRWLGAGLAGLFPLFPVHVYWAVAFTSSVAVVLGLYAEMKT